MIPVVGHSKNKKTHKRNPNFNVFFQLPRDGYNDGKTRMSHWHISSTNYHSIGHWSPVTGHLQPLRKHH